LELYFYIFWGLGIGDWGLGFGQFPIRNPQSPIYYLLLIKIKEN